MLEEALVYVGTYTRRRSRGIYVYRMDPSSGALRLASVAAGGDNPSFLAVDPLQRFLYAVNEVEEYAGKPGGSVSAFSIDPKTGGLTYLNRQPSLGVHPCHLSVDETGRYVLVANYTGGTVSVLPIRGDGSLGAATDLVQHKGSSVNPQRQREPHPHSVFLDPSNRFAFVPDLGMDKVMIYRLDLTRGKLVPNEEPWVRVEPGAGPRHFVFHPGGKHAYVINEINSTITAFAYDEARGALESLQTVPTLPVGFTGESSCADVHVTPSGKFLYGSNRGHDSVVIYKIEASGLLTYVGHEPTQGRTPRNFTIEPTGAFLLVANQDTETIVTFRIDQETGRLTPTGQVIEVSMPVCLKTLVGKSS